MKRLLIAIAFFACALSAGESSFGPVPTSPTALVSTTVRLDRARFVNTTAGALTITITDQGTNCSSSVCDVWKTISIAANTYYEVNFAGVPMVGGFKWSASNTGVNGWVSWY